MGDWNGLSSSINTVLTFTRIKALLVDAATLFKSTPTNPVDGMIRFNRSTWAFEEYDSATTTWIPRPLGLSGGGHGGNDAATARANLELGDVALKDTIETDDITDGAVTVEKITGLGSLALKNQIANTDIPNSTITPSKVTGFGSFATKSSVLAADIAEPVPVNRGGGGGNTKEANRSNWEAAKSGNNSDITNLSAYADQGWYPSWFYVPSPGASGAIFVYFARFMQIGSWVCFQFHGTINITTAHNVIYLTLPRSVLPLTSSKWQSGSGEAFIPGVGFVGIKWRSDGPNKDVHVRREDNSNFPAVSGIEINIGGGYAASQT